MTPPRPGHRPVYRCSKCGFESPAEDCPTHDAPAERARKQKRATVVVAQNDGKVLLVRRKGQKQFALPGGTVKPNEAVVSAAIRAVTSKTGLIVQEIRRVFDYESDTQLHVVFTVRAQGEERPKAGVVECRWWDGRKSLPLFDHVPDILRYFDRMAA